MAVKSIALPLKHTTLRIELPEGVAADPKLLDGGHPLYYILKTPNATVTYLNAVAELYRGIDRIDDVLEYCGGIGLIPATLKEVIRWDTWTTVELDPACQAVYQEREAKFILGSMYDEDNYPTPGLDLVFMDFPNNTLPKMWREEPRAKLLNAVADSRPKYWHITDVGYYWIHLANHWPLYEKQFGVKPTRLNYHELFDRYMRENYGYKVIRWTVGGGAQYFLMQEV